MDKNLKNELIERINFHFESSLNIHKNITFKNLKLSKTEEKEIEGIINMIQANIISDISKM